MSDAHIRLAGFGIHRQVVVQVGERGFRAAQHVALVAGVVRPQECAVFADERGLERGGSGVYAQIRRARVGHEVAPAHAFGVVAALEGGMVFLTGEQRGQAHHFRSLDVAQALQALQHVVQPFGAYRLAGRPGNGAAAGHEQVRVVGHDAVLFVQLERFVEALAQFGKVLQRPAEEGHVAADGPPACQAGYGLRDHRLEDGCGDVLLARALVQQRLHVGFREHAAAAGDGIDGLRVLRQLVQAARIGVQKRGHLVDERARAAGARAVHALLDALVEVDDLGILATQFYGDVGQGNEGFHGRLAGDDLLHELHAQPLRQKQPARAGDGDGHGAPAKRFGRCCRSGAAGKGGAVAGWNIVGNGAAVGRNDGGGSFFQHLHDGGAHVGVMAAVHRELDLVRLVENCQLYRGRSHIDADMQVVVLLAAEI